MLTICPRRVNDNVAAVKRALSVLDYMPPFMSRKIGVLYVGKVGGMLEYCAAMQQQHCVVGGHVLKEYCTYQQLRFTGCVFFLERVLLGSRRCRSPRLVWRAMLLFNRSQRIALLTKLCVIRFLSSPPLR
jgi:hypothetical protein